MKRIIILWIVCILFSLTYAGKAVASNMITIQYSVDHHSQAIEGASFRLVKVAALSENAYHLLSPWSEMKVSMEQIFNDSANLAKKFANYKKMPAGYLEKTDNKGTIVFDHLEDGIWLLYEDRKEQQASLYENAAPVFLQIPQWQKNKYLTEIFVYPKTTLVREGSKPDKEEQKDASRGSSGNLSSQANSKTGDYSNAGFCFILLIAAMAVLQINLLFKRESR